MINGCNTQLKEKVFICKRFDLFGGFFYISNSKLCYSCHQYHVMQVLWWMRWEVILSMWFIHLKPVFSSSGWSTHLHICIAAHFQLSILDYEWTWFEVSSFWGPGFVSGLIFRDEPEVRGVRGVKKAWLILNIDIRAPPTKPSFQFEWHLIGLHLNIID